MFDLVKAKAETMAKKVFEKLGMDEKAEGGLFKLVIGLFIIVILVSALIPTAITSIVQTNTTGWSTGTTSTWGALPIFIVVVILAVLAGIAYKAFDA